MECLAAFFMLIMLTIAITTVISTRLTQRRRRRQFFKHLAKQFAGVYDSGGLFSRPSVRLRYGDTWATVRESNSVGPIRGRALQVRVAWPHVRSQCEITDDSERIDTRDWRYTWPGVYLDTEFGKKYLLRGPDEDEIRQLLTSGVCWHIERLRHLGDTHRIYILFNDSEILVQKPWKKVRGDIPAQFVQGVLELYDQCMLAKASGIEFLYNDEAQTLGDVICKICGDSITEDLVYCRRCKTPHHRECWRYTGVCSVFACGETMYLVPQAGHMPSNSPHVDVEKQPWKKIL